MTSRIRHLDEVKAADYLTVEEAAEVLGIKANSVRNYLHFGQMITYKFKQSTLLKRSDVEAWKSRQNT